MQRQYDCACWLVSAGLQSCLVVAIFRLQQILFGIIRNSTICQHFVSQALFTTLGKFCGDLLDAVG